jgi:hypothetical protein
MGQLVAELVDERPCPKEIAIHVRSLVVHGFQRPIARACVRVETIKLPSTWVKANSGDHVASLKWSSSRQVSLNDSTFLCIRPVTTTGQFCTKAVFSKNLEAVSGIITDAAKAGARMVFLPEASDFITKADEAAALIKPLAENEFVQGVRAKAKETGVWVSVGVHETVRALPRIMPFTVISVIQSGLLSTVLFIAKSSDPKRGFNSHLVIDSSGDIVSNYHKIHLFVRHARFILDCAEGRIA